MNITSPAPCQEIPCSLKGVPVDPPDEVSARLPSPAGMKRRMQP
ncbi:hypothetical protein E2C01_087431 [Portunus trituberculatus]|uniref:Uncharacterized protein n=1 Tax=Portunus trituberculatus TaxID=210409 RepID=A0A5B7JH98_PORTR|nr:hypothetical protein [Portunus trituberculatus]